MTLLAKASSNLTDRPVWGLGARLTTLLCKKITVAKANGVETGSYSSQECTNLAEPSKEGYGCKRAVFPMIMMIFTLKMMMTMFMSEQYKL
jgi:hypothetical protein